MREGLDLAEIYLQNALPFLYDELTHENKDFLYSVLPVLFKLQWFVRGSAASCIQLKDCAISLSVFKVPSLTMIPNISKILWHLVVSPVASQQEGAVSCQSPVLIGEHLNWP